MVGEGDFVAEDVGEGGVSIGTFEGGATVKHFVD